MPKIIVTRDKGYGADLIALWPEGANLRILSGCWDYKKGEDGECLVINFKTFKAIFGFVPRKGFKQTVELGTTRKKN